MLATLGKDLKAAIISMHNEVKKNTLRMNEKIRILAEKKNLFLKRGKYRISNCKIWCL